MAMFKINPDIKLSAAQTKKLETLFKKIEDKEETVRKLEEAASKYFEELDDLGALVEQLAERTDEDEPMVVTEEDGEEIDAYDYNYTAAAANLFDFWIPSSMSC